MFDGGEDWEVEKIKKRGQARGEIAEVNWMCEYRGREEEKKETWGEGRKGGEGLIGDDEGGKMER